MLKQHAVQGQDPGIAATPETSQKDTFLTEEVYLSDRKII